MSKALLLVDIQNDFLPGGALAVPEGDRVIAVANALIPKFAHVFASQDWHPPGHVSFEEWPEHCVQNTHGAALASDLGAVVKVFQKGSELNKDAYSAFATDLGAHLKEKGVTHLYVMGLATDYCVKATVLDGLKEGFDVTLIVDGCRAIGDEQKAVDEMREAGAHTIVSKELL